MHRAPMFVSCCHCTDCRKQSGSAFAVFAAVEAAAVRRVAGNPVAVALKTDGGTVHVAWRCPHCHSPLWDDYGVPGVWFVRVAALDAAAAIRPDVHIFTRSKLPWVRLPEGVPTFDGGYDPESLWPPESWARRRTAANAVAKA